MGKEAEKTKQIGVRFNKDLLEGVVKGELARSPQMALNLYEKSFIELVELKVKKNNQPENKQKIEEERNVPNEAASKAKNPLTESESVKLPENNATTTVMTDLEKRIEENRKKYLK